MATFGWILTTENSAPRGAWTDLGGSWWVCNQGSSASEIFVYSAEGRFRYKMTLSDVVEITDVALDDNTMWVADKDDGIVKAYVRYETPASGITATEVTPVRDSAKDLDSEFNNLSGVALTTERILTLDSLSTRGRINSFTRVGYQLSESYNLPSSPHPKELFEYYGLIYFVTIDTLGNGVIKYFDFNNPSMQGAVLLPADDQGDTVVPAGITRDATTWRAITADGDVLGWDVASGTLLDHLEQVGTSARVARTTDTTSETSVSQYIHPSNSLNLMVSQYTVPESPLYKLTEQILAYMDANVMPRIKAYYDGLFIDKCAGKYLDYIGSRVGLERPSIRFVNRDLFGFDNPPALPFDRGVFQTAVEHPVIARSLTGATDETYRALIKINARLNYSNGSVSELSDILLNVRNADGTEVFTSLVPSELLGFVEVAGPPSYLPSVNDAEGVAASMEHEIYLVSNPRQLYERSSNGIWDFIDLPSSFAADLRGIAVDVSGRLYIVDVDGTIYFRETDRSWQTLPFSQPPILSTDRANGISVDKDRNLYIITNSRKLYKYTRSSDSWSNSAFNLAEITNPRGVGINLRNEIYVTTASGEVYFGRDPTAFRLSDKISTIDRNRRQLPQFRGLSVTGESYYGIDVDGRIYVRQIPYQSYVYDDGILNPGTDGRIFLFTRNHELAQVLTDNPEYIPTPAGVKVTIDTQSV